MLASDEGHRPRVERSVALRIEGLAEGRTLVVTGPLGIGKSFIAKSAVARKMEKAPASSLALFWGWDEDSGRRVVEIALPSYSSASWVDVLDPKVDGMRIAGDLSPGAFASALRHIAAPLEKVLGNHGDVYVIVDKLNVVLGRGIAIQDVEALVKLRAEGARIVVEVRGSDREVVECEGGVASLLQPRRLVKVEAPSLEEMHGIAAEMLLTGGLPLARGLGDDVRLRLAEYLLAMVGCHPGTLGSLVEAAGEIARTSGVDDLTELFSEKCIQRAALTSTKLESYLRRLWDQISPVDRTVVASVAVADETMKSARGIGELWIRSLGGGEGVKMRWERAWERAIRSGLIVEDGRGEDSVAIGQIAASFARGQSEYDELLSRTGLMGKKHFQFNWSKFLGWWLLSLGLYFSLSALSWTLSMNFHQLFWFLCWLPAIAYVVVYFFARVVLVGRRSATVTRTLFGAER